MRSKYFFMIFLLSSAPTTDEFNVEFQRKKETEHWRLAMPKVSIVLPSYNGEQYLQQSIDSIVNQNYSDWELIIVDDCSTDATPEIAKRYSDLYPNILYHRNETNLKLPASLNVGFSLASGEYYTWTSDDNYYDTNAINLMATELDSNSSISVVYCDINCIDENGAPIHLPKITTSKRCLPLINVVRACFMYRADVHLALGGYDESLFLVEDYDFWLRAYRSFGFKYIDCAPYYYRFHGNSLSKTKELDIRQRTSAILHRELQESPALSRKIVLLGGIALNAIRAFAAKITNRQSA